MTRRAPGARLFFSCCRSGHGLFLFSGVGPVFRWQNAANVAWALGEFGAGLSAKYKSGYVDEDPEVRVPSYTTVDGYLSWTQKKGFGSTRR